MADIIAYTTFEVVKELATPHLLLSIAKLGAESFFPLAASNAGGGAGGASIGAGPGVGFGAASGASFGVGFGAGFGVGFGSRWWYWFTILISNMPRRVNIRYRIIFA